MPIYTPPVQWGTHTASGNWFEDLPFVANNDWFGAVFDLSDPGVVVPGNRFTLSFDAQPLGRFDGEPKPEHKHFGSLYFIDKVSNDLFSQENPPRAAVAAGDARLVYSFEPGGVTTGVNLVELSHRKLRAHLARAPFLHIILGPVFGQPGDIVLNGDQFSFAAGDPAGGPGA